MTAAEVRAITEDEGPTDVRTWPQVPGPEAWVVPREASTNDRRGVRLMTITPSEGADAWWGVSILRSRSSEPSLLEALVLGFGKRHGVRAFSGTTSLDSVELQRAWLSWVATQPAGKDDPDRSIERREHFTRALHRK